MTFSEQFDQLPIQGWVKAIANQNENDVASVLRKQSWKLEDLPTLLSEAAANQLEPMAQISYQLTRQRFGHVMQMFIPMYLSNVCYNSCTYCGFSMENNYKRITLSPQEMINEALILKKKGFDHLLLLTGEADKSSTDYIENAIQLLHPYFSSIGIEVQPLSVSDYHRMIKAGADNLTVYQETYHPESYQIYHKAGKKRNFAYRLDTPDRGGEAGFYRMNLGALMGLYDWQYEAIALGFHLNYLQKKYWKTKYSVSFPRIRDVIGDFKPKYPITDAQLTQLICAFRMIFPDLGITLSTREPAYLRDHLSTLGITTMSAESNTSPGGYSGKEGTEEQFEISDHRSLADIQAMLYSNGLEPVFKDWDKQWIETPV